ncbi:MAG: PilZ domain-containing protein [Methylococcales bacterium]|nr:PilZ domain-containing protein [Methylococcales bacterium]
MSEEKRSYRTNLTSRGLIYMGGEELQIIVKNLSITGVMAELEDSSSLKDIKDVFQVIKATPVIDIYLPEMRLAGDAEVVRAEMDGENIVLFIEFKDISYEVDNVLYKRKAYRKNIAGRGQIVFDGVKYKFNTENVSVDGLMIHLKEKIEVEKGVKTIFDFKQLALRGVIKVVWVDHCDDGSTLMGLQYEHLEKDHVSGIPAFTSLPSD